MNGRGRLPSLPRRIKYALLAGVLAAGAPLGLLALRLAALPETGFGAARREMQSDSLTYLYVSVSTLVVFASFGYVLGRQADALARLSATDPLTGLANARAFEDRVRQEIARAARYGEPLSLLLADVDRLKAINDRDGHRAGSRALQAVGRALDSGGRGADLAARVGGDEFALLAPNTSLSAATALAERVRALVAGERIDGLTVSIGVATMAGPVADFRDLWDSADRALYEAKRQGRNRVVTSAPP